MIFLLDGLRVYFPFPHIYPEQYEYMRSLKRVLDASLVRHEATSTTRLVPQQCLLEMPSGTGKTVSLLSLLMSYQLAHATTLSKIVYCSRTVAEIEKVLEEAKVVYAAMPYATQEQQQQQQQRPLVLGLSSRRNLCTRAATRQADDVDSACYDARQDEKCEQYKATTRDQSLRGGVYTLDDLKRVAAPACPYYLARQLLPLASLVVFSYQYVLDPAISRAVLRQLTTETTALVFDEAHNIDGVCVDALSSHLTRVTLDKAARNVQQLREAVRKAKAENRATLEADWRLLVAEDDADSLRAHGSAATPLPADLPVPGNIRRAEHFVALLRRLVLFLAQRQRPPPTQTLLSLRAELLQQAVLDCHSLRFVERRLAQLLSSLQLRQLHSFAPLQAVAACAAVAATAVRAESFVVLADAAAPLQLVCLDPSLALAPIVASYRVTIITSGTMSPLEMYPRVLNFAPSLTRRLPMSLARPAICPLFVTRGADQVALSSKFDARDDVAVVRNYAALLAELAAVVPDGIVAFFPSYRYLEAMVAAWHSLALLAPVLRHKLLFVETDSTAETSVALLNYRRACDVGRGAVLLAVARGKVSEGIDFDHHYARAVLLFGVPYMYTESRVLRARLQFLREQYRVRESEWLVFDALRQSSQCIGRVVRGKRDYGLVVLADRRFNRRDKVRKLPQWIQQHVEAGNMNLSTDMAVEIAKQFLKEMAQPFAAADQLGTALWTLEHIEQQQQQQQQQQQ